MPIALVLIGLLMVVSGSKDTYQQFGSELLEDMTGQQGFIWWIAAIGSVGAIGYYPPARTFSRYFLVLVLLSMLISNQGFFGKLTGGLNTTPVKPTEPEQPEVNSGGTGAAAPGSPNYSDFLSAFSAFGPGNAPKAPKAPEAPQNVGDVIGLISSFGQFVLPFLGA